MLQLLIVENSNETKESLCQAVDWDSLGMKIAGACTNSMQACAILANTPIDILITNIELSGADGLELADYVHHNYPNIKVIIMSEYKDLHSLLAGTMNAGLSAKASIKRIVTLTQNYVEIHLFEKSLNLKQVAADLHINYYYLSKCFKEGTGISFTEYVSIKRLQAAAKLLSDTPLHIYEICRQIGMEPKNFHGLFRKHFQMTPQTYRRQNGQR